MFQPETYSMALALMLVSMLCWGSWANAVKLCPGYRFQLFYWDYVVGLVVGTALWGLTLGSLGGAGKPFLADIASAPAQSIVWSLVGGVLFNAANLLLVAAIEVAGLAVAFPVGIGLALIVGAVSSYLLSPQGNPWLLFGGITLVVGAIVCDAIAYRLRENQHKVMSRRGLVISLISGLLMGSFYPFVSHAMSGVGAPGPYAVCFFFVVGVALCAIPMNYVLMRRPLDGQPPVSLAGYRTAPIWWHVWGVIGGSIWLSGAISNFVASRAHVVGPAVSYSIGQGATMISACWGVFVWHEFATAPVQAKRYVVWMFVLFVAGLSLVAIAPIF
jgi:glucose uptake protein